MQSPWYPARDMKAGTVLDGKYELTKRIGDGAMGVVWAGINVRTERDVAIKVLLATGREQDRQRLLREARAGGKIRHPNVLDVYDVAETDTGAPFIVMELLEGETLEKRLARSPVMLGEALRILRDVARALSAAHKVGVVHRDLKPRNVFLHNEPDTPLPIVKLIEFGISRIDAEAALTLSGGAMGAPAYVAPEQIEGLAIDRRADIWSFGALAFELLSGAPPFADKTAPEIVKLVLAGAIPPLPRVAHEVDGGLRELVGRCMVRIVDQRMESIDEAVSTIEKLLKRVNHPAMAALAEVTPERPLSDDEATVVTRRGPRTLRMGSNAPVRPVSDLEVTRLETRPIPAEASPHSDPPTTERTPLAASTTPIVPDVITGIGTTEPLAGPETIDETARRPVDTALLEAGVDEPPPPSKPVLSSSWMPAAPPAIPRPITPLPPPPVKSEPPTSGAQSLGSLTSTLTSASSLAPSPSEPPPPEPRVSDPSSVPPVSGPRELSEPSARDSQSLSAKELETFREEGAQETSTALARQKRMSRIAIGAVAVVVAGIGVAVLVRSTASDSASPGSPSAAKADPSGATPPSNPTPTTTAAAPTTAAEAVETSSPTPPPVPSAEPTASSAASAAAMPSTTSTAKATAPGNPKPPRTPPPKPPPNDPSGPGFNPTTL